MTFSNKQLRIFANSVCLCTQNVLIDYSGQDWKTVSCASVDGGQEGQPETKPVKDEAITFFSFLVLMSTSCCREL